MPLNEANLPKFPQGMPSLEMGHKHSGHDALMSGGANACPICQAFKIQGLQSQLTAYQFQDGQHFRVLHDVIQHLKAWHEDGLAALNAATYLGVKNDIADRVIAYKEAEILLQAMLKEILKRTEDAHTKSGSGIKAENSGT